MATSSHSLHCSPLSPARAFSCLLYCWVPLSINHLTTTASDLSQQIARNVLHLSPAGFMPCSSNVGEKNNSAVHSAEMHGRSTRRKVLAWTCGSNLAFFFALYLCGLNIHTESFTLEVLTIASLLTVNHMIVSADTTCKQMLASRCSGAARSTWSSAFSLNTCKTFS